MVQKEHLLDSLTPQQQVTRRAFVKHSAAVALGAGLLGKTLSADAGSFVARREMQKRVLGRTGLEVTDVSFGGIQIQQARLLEAAIDSGINLVHTAPSYGGGVSIRLFGEVMKTRRDDVFLALKQNPIGGIDESLKILNTDHVDILIPGIGSTRDMDDAELEDAFGKLKEEGKIRFSGLAIHKSVTDVISHAVDKGYFDLMLVAYNLGNREEVDPFLARASEEQNMGIMVMKAMRGIEKADPASVTAGFKSLLENPILSTLLVGMSSFGELENNTAVSGVEMGWMDRARVRRYAHLTTTACAACGACESACPRGVAVADIMRHKMYADRGERELAISSYGSLPAGASLANCDDCGICEQACPRQRPVMNDLAAVRRVVA